MRENLRKDLYEKYGYSVGNVFVQDLAGLGWKHLSKDCQDILKTLSVIDADNFPETVRKMYIINVPHLFSIAWKIVKPMVDKRTLSKLAIFGTDGYEEELRELIDMESLPVWAGGNHDNIAVGVTFKNQKVEDENEVESTEDWDIVKIKSKEKFSLPFKIRKKNTTVGWRFKTVENDIGFYISYKRNETSDEIVVKDSVRLLEDSGSFLCKRKGIYNLIFDNSFSIFKNKKIKYQTYTSKSDKKRGIDLTEDKETDEVIIEEINNGTETKEPDNEEKED